MGGKIIDRTWFFAGYEGLRLRQSGTFTGRVPTPAMVAGNFAGSGITIRDPRTGLPFDGNVIPRARLDSIGRQLAAAYPAPNAPGLRNFISNPVNTLRRRYLHRAGDRQLSDHNRILGRFNFQNIHELQPVNLFAAHDDHPGLRAQQEATRSSPPASPTRTRSPTTCSASSVTGSIVGNWTTCTRTGGLTSLGRSA